MQMISAELVHQHPSSSVKQRCLRVCLPMSILYFDRGSSCDIRCNHSELLSQLPLCFALAIGTLELKSSFGSIHDLHNESSQA